MPENPRYKVLTGLNYPPDNQRAAAGSVVDDLPEASLPWLLAEGLVEPTDAPLARLDDAPMTQEMN